MMKIYHKVDYWKGYIPSDKVHYNHIPFEGFGLSNFGIDSKEWNKRFREQVSKEGRSSVILALKDAIKKTAVYLEAIKEGHTAYYLNFNMDGVQGFISR
jgi:hypothetical protein